MLNLKNDIDPDVMDALRDLAADEETQRVLKVRKRHAREAEDRFETQMELLSDEVARIIPRAHPLFESVLILAVLRKLEKKQQEPEFHSYLDFPSGW